MNQRYPYRLPTGSRARRGAMLLEVSIAAAVLAVALTGLLSVIVSANTLRKVNRETAIANEAARELIENAQGLAFDQILANYQANPDFDVQGLRVQNGDADGFAGEVMFPTVTNGGVVELREDVQDAALGMPRDLNGDGVIDSANHAGDYVLLPMRIRLQWRSVTGNRTLDIETLLTRR